MKKVQVVITRPLNQVQKLLVLCADRGLIAHTVPLIKIVPTTNITALKAAQEEIHEVDGVILISPTAIEYALQDIAWPSHVPAFVVGPGSLLCAQQHGIDPVFIPQTTFDSEGLLALPELKNVQGKCFILFRGNGGRELLIETLEARGAKVKCIEAYQRVPTTLTVEDWHVLKQSHAILITSSAAAKYLFLQADEKQLDYLKGLLYFVSHRKIASTLQELGAKMIEEGGLTDQAMVAKVRDFFRKDSECV